MSTSDWMPDAEGPYVKMCNLWGNMLDSETAPVLFKWDSELKTFTLGKITGFLDALQLYQEMPTIANRVAKDEAKQEARAAMRTFANSEVRYNVYMSKKQRLELGIKTPDASKTPIGDPVGLPTATVTVPNDSELTLNLSHVKDSPYDARANAIVKIVWGVFPLDAPAPTSIDQLPRNVATRRKKETIKFDLQDSGKRAYFSLRYENSKGKVGQWCKIFSAIIT